jgi:heterotetrameric sarcosine oxidase gamma subunit
MNGSRSPAVAPIRRSPAHRLQAALGARFATEASWEIPVSFGKAEEERSAARLGVAIVDITARAKVDVRGDLEKALSRLAGTPPTVRSVVTGGAKGSERMHVARLGFRWALVLAEPSVGEGLLAAVDAAIARDEGMVTDVTGMLAGFALAGPKALELLSRLTPLDLVELAPGTCAATRVAEVAGVLVRPPTPGGVVELYVGSEYGRFAWETLRAAGEVLGAVPAGWETLWAEGWW